jgi:hypothetical protein
MMLFAEDGEFVQVLIPHVDDHEFMHGLPTGLVDSGSIRCVSGTGIKPLPGGKQYQLDGPKPAKRKLLSLISPTTQVCLHAHTVEVIPGAARNAFRVPMPDLIRQFRYAEVNDVDVRGKTAPDTFLAKPTTISEIACFSYLNVPWGTEISIGDLTTIKIGAQGASYCLYAQSTKVEAQHQGVHPTSLNDLLRLKDKDRSPTDLRLSQVGSMDGVPEPAPGTGLTKCHLSSLFELQGFHTRLGGCGHAIVAETTKAAQASLQGTS